MKTKDWLIVAALVGFVAIGTGAVSLSRFSTAPTGGSGPGGSGLTCTNNYSPPSGYSCAQWAILFQLNDGLAGGGLQKAITLYYPTGVLTGDSGTASSAGALTTGQKYTTGQQLVAGISGSGLIQTLYQPFIVPPLPSSVSCSTTCTLQVNLYDTTLATYTVTAVAQPSGSALSSGQTLYFGNLGITTYNIQYTVSTATVNTGYKASYDVVNKQNQYLVMQWSDGGAATVTATGYQFTAKSGSTTYWYDVIPDGLTISGCNLAPTAICVPTDPTGAFPSAWTVNAQSTFSNNNVVTSGSASEYKQGTTLVGGSAIMAISFNKGSLSTSATITEQMYNYADPFYAINNNGNLGPDAATTGSAFTTVYKP